MALNNSGVDAAARLSAALLKLDHYTERASDREWCEARDAFLTLAIPYVRARLRDGPSVPRFTGHEVASVTDAVAAGAFKDRLLLLFRAETNIRGELFTAWDLACAGQDWDGADMTDDPSGRLIALRDQIEAMKTAWQTLPPCDPQSSADNDFWNAYRVAKVKLADLTALLRPQREEEEEDKSDPRNRASVLRSETEPTRSDRHRERS